MRKAFFALVGGAVALGLSSVAMAQPKAAESTTPQVPRCARSLGTISIQNGDSAGWTGYQLQPPAALLRVIVQQSACFTVVERGAGLDAALKERELSGGGNLQRGSNVGGGQMRAADYVLLADVIAQNNNSSGGAVGGLVGGMIGGRLGGVVGGMGMRSQTAQTTLTLTNVRTTESYSVEGNARNRNLTWGGIGVLGGGGVGLGGYTNTEIGRVITTAYIDAYTNLVGQAGGLDPNASGSAPRETYKTTRAAPLRRYPVDGAAVVRTLPVGATVYPTGEKEGMYWKVADENDNEGWVNNDFLQQAQ